MLRVAVVGPGGAGKTTFARRLGERTGLPVIHLDRHFWHPGWLESPREEWRRVQAQLLTGERWIADGNYSGTLDVRLALADTVIVLNPGRLRCVAGVLRRWLRNRGTAIQAPGCPERLDRTFLLWVWRWERDGRNRVVGAIRRHAGHLRVVELRSRGAAEAFLGGL
jgi:adenylate kinase family enzyme